MLSITEADALVAQHLGDAPRANHSRVVAHVMRKLAEALSEPAELWEVVGLCHDLDFFAIQGDWSVRIRGRTRARGSREKQLGCKLGL